MIGQAGLRTLLFSKVIICMKRNIKRWVSVKTLKYFAYIPAIICKIINWPAFMLNYLGFTNRGGTYYFRNGTEICDREGTLTGIIAVVFIRKNYGDIRNETVIVDIGANIGVFSIYAATQAKNATVYAFEPVPANYELLAENIRTNGLNDRIRTFKLGVASNSGKRNIYLSCARCIHWWMNRINEALKASIAYLLGILSK